LERLGLRKSTHEGQTTLLARQSHEAIDQANGEKTWHQQGHWLAYLRHSFGTLLKANGEDVKTVQELLRYANSRVTLDVYTQATTSNKHAAQSRVVKMILPNLGEK
jgi:site-specific recombinase XerD